MDYEKAEHYARQLLQSRLSPLLTYHDFRHTLDVLDAATELARSEQVTGDDLVLLKTAALFHDCGYVNVYDQHEEESCRIVRESLPGFGYTPDQVKVICDMIMKTKMTEPPVTHLEKILCDADLFYLSGDDFEKRGEKLFREWKTQGILDSEQEWNTMQVRFLERHHFYTRTASERGNLKKSEHLQKLKKLV